MHLYASALAHSCMLACRHPYTCTDTHTHTHSHSLTHSHTEVIIGKHAHTFTHARVHTHTHTHTLIHAHACSHAHTYTHSFHHTNTAHNIQSNVYVVFMLCVFSAFLSEMLLCRFLRTSDDLSSVLFCTWSSLLYVLLRSFVLYVVVGSWCFFGVEAFMVEWLSGSIHYVLTINLLNHHELVAFYSVCVCVCVYLSVCLSVRGMHVCMHACVCLSSCMYLCVFERERERERERANMFL